MSKLTLAEFFPGKGVMFECGRMAASIFFIVIFLPGGQVGIASDGGFREYYQRSVSCSETLRLVRLLDFSKV